MTRVILITFLRLYDSSHALCPLLGVKTRIIIGWQSLLTTVHAKYTRN